MQQTLNRFIEIQKNRDRANRYYKNNPEHVKENVKKYRQNNKQKIKEYEHNRYLKNREDYLERVHKYQENNREEIRRKDREDYWNNREKIRENRRFLYQQNIEKAREVKRNWCNNNREKVRDINRRRRAKRRKKNFIQLFPNIFPKEIPIDWHHIDGKMFVVPLPKRVHQRTVGCVTNAQVHLDKANAWVEFYYDINPMNIIREEGGFSHD